jgi:hypothetical protein
MRKYLATIFAVVALLQGCAVVPASGYPVGGGWYHYSYPHYRGGSGITTEPCQPYRADGLMKWALGAGGDVQHSRTAGVTVKNGNVDCRQSESASSSSSKRAPKQGAR